MARPGFQEYLVPVVIQVFALTGTKATDIHLLANPDTHALQ